MNSKYKKKKKMQKIPTDKHQLTKDLNVNVSFGQNDRELIKERKK